MEFSCTGRHPSDYFPIHVLFTSNKSYCAIEPTDVTLADDSTQNIKFSTETLLQVDKYEIV